MHSSRRIFLTVGILGLLICLGCTGSGSNLPTLPVTTPAQLQGGALATPVSIIPTEAFPRQADDLSTAEVASLSSLRKVSDYPLYSLDYSGPYPPAHTYPTGHRSPASMQSTWACSLFAALADPQSHQFGRNFDWRYSPALLLFTAPADGYRSVSMVDLAYLVDSQLVAKLDELPLPERRALLEAPYWPFDGMNEKGLAIGMAAVPPGNVPIDENKETLDSLRIMRQVLDYAQDLAEAQDILQNYNIDFGSGPPLHYLIADRSGQAVLVEFSRGQIVLIPNTEPWQAATNFLQSEVSGPAEGQCWRYAILSRRLGETGGRLGPVEALGLLAQVAQDNTQWSVVYGLTTGEISVAMGRNYAQVHRFTLK